MLKIVVSGVSMVEGGILRILKDVLSSLSALQNSYDLSVTVLVHNADLVKEHDNKFKILAFPDVKSSWSNRLRFEYVTSKQLSEKFKPDLWISLHDMTPNVVCPVQVVYCHNPSAFYEEPLRKFFKYDLTFTLFTLFYKYLYRVNIRKNKYVIVQQNWIRKAFKKMYGVDSIVAYPRFPASNNTQSNGIALPFELREGCVSFFYPSFPRVFKNMECVCEAAETLSKTHPDFELIITVDGSENKYASKIYKDYKHIRQIKFIGLQPHQVIEELYARVDCLIFPSKLETWGLPISEFIPYNKPILAADMPYAHETIGSFGMANYFKPDAPSQLVAQMLQVIEDRFIPQYSTVEKPAEPFFENWEDLLKFLLEKTSQATNALR